MPSIPKIGVGTETLFTQMQANTQPQFNLLWSDRANACFPQRNFADAGAFASAGNTGSIAGVAGVQVVLEQEVGPYDAKVIESTDAQALVTWLNENGYDQPPSALPFIRHYVDRKMKFLAIKLLNDANVGDITPLVLDMDEPDPCVPLVLTRVAATPDMPIWIYVLGNARALPKNWFHVEINPNKIDWFRGGTNYNALASAAINEAAGHGFITEFAGKTPNLGLGGAGLSLEPLRATKDPVAAIEFATQNLPRSASGTVLGLLRKFVPMPQSLRDQGVAENQFYNFPSAYKAALAGVEVDGNAFADGIDERILKPMKSAGEMLARHPYLTRLYSTVSPDEMTRDPLFALHPNLPEVSNIHTAKGDGRCVNGRLEDVLLTMPSGARLAFPGAISIFAPPVWMGGSQERSAEHIAFVPAGQPPLFLTPAQARTGDEVLQTLDAGNLRASDFGDRPADDVLYNRPSNLSTTFPPGWDPGKESPTMVDDPAENPFAGDDRGSANDGDGCACKIGHGPGRESNNSNSWSSLLLIATAFGFARRRGRKRNTNRR